MRILVIEDETELLRDIAKGLTLKTLPPWSRA